MNNGYFQTPAVVKNLLVINGLVFLAMALIPAVNGFLSIYCALNLGLDHFGLVFHSWQTVTYMFMHADFNHLFFNMLALWMFGRVIEYELGSRRFLTYYMACGIGAALIQIAIAFGFHSPMTVVGASGAVYGLLLAFGVLHPNAPMFIMFIPVPVKAKWVVLGYGLLELLAGWRGGSNVAHFAHLGGMLWGLMLLLWWKRRGIIRF